MPPIPPPHLATPHELGRRESELGLLHMAGLSVLLEAYPNHSQIICKTSLLKNSLPPRSGAHGPGTFLDRCCLCRRKLQQGKDIYMYRGDRAFCSEECRCRQMLMDEETGAWRQPRTE